jgi:hypothetical protein
MIDDDGRHADCVDAWLEQSARGLSSPALRRLVDAALGALWARTKTTLGEVTLTAIAERVLYTTAEKYPILASFKVEPLRGIEFRGMEALPPPPETELRAGARFLLVELLSVLGKLTAEILTPELHAELMAVVLPQAVHLVTGTETSTGPRKTHAGEGGQ